MDAQKHPLFTRDFTLVVIGQIVSLFGNAILHFALPLYLLRETGSLTLFGVVNACSFLPMILMGPIGGTAADRVNAVVNMVHTLANLLGPALGGVIFGLWGLGPILVIGGACFFSSAVMELFIHIPHERRPRSSGVLATVRQDLCESWRFIAQERPIFLSVTLVLSAFNFLLSAVMIVGIPALVAQVLGMSDTFMGLTQAALGLGGLLGGLLAGVLGPRLKPRHGSFCLLACSALAAVMGLSVLPGVPVWVSYWMVTAAALLTMSAATLFTVVLLTLVQSQVPPQLLGKVIACIQAVANCASPLGQAAYGVLFDSLPPWSVLLGAAALSALTALRSRRVFLRLETEAVPE